MEDWEVLQRDRERIKNKMVELLNKEISQRKKMAKWKSKHTIPISRVQKLVERFFLYVDDPDYDIKWH